MSDTISPVPGKSYRVRNGEKYDCGFINPNGGDICVAGYIGNQIFTHTRCGKHHSNRAYDITAEWKEPREFTVYMYDDEEGGWFASKMPPNCCLNPLLCKGTLKEGDGLNG